MNSPLNAEERELLRDLLFNHDGAKVFLSVLEHLVGAVEKDVLRYSLVDSDDDAHGLLRVKCEAQGARKLFSLFRSHLQGIRLDEQKRKLTHARSRRKNRRRS